MEEKLEQIAKLTHEILFYLTPIEVEGQICISSILGDDRKNEFIEKINIIKKACREIEKLAIDLIANNTNTEEKPLWFLEYINEEGRLIKNLYMINSFANDCKLKREDFKDFLLCN